MVPPQGLTIGSTAKPWTIGRKLGSGACGSVHELIPPPNASAKYSYAIKLAALPRSAKPATGKKRKKTAQERNADLISHEHLTLQNLGPDVRGRLVPDIPFMGSPPAYGDLDGEMHEMFFFANQLNGLNTHHLLELCQSSRSITLFQMPRHYQAIDIW